MAKTLKNLPLEDYESDDMSSIDVNRSMEHLPHLNRSPTDAFDGGGGDNGGGRNRGAGLVTKKSSPPQTGSSTSTATTITADHYKNGPQKQVTLISVIKSKFFISVVIVAAMFITLLCIGLVVVYEKDNDITQSIDAWKDKLSQEQAEWFDAGLDELKIALQVKINSRRAKNIILFVGDGMGPATVTASRIYKNGEEGLLEWEKFPHMGLLKTYCVDKQVPDSAVSATALFGGVKGNYETAGVDSAVPLAVCNKSLSDFHQVESILKLAQDEGMSTGFVTTTRVVHATPAALYSHTADRRWECDSKMPPIAHEQGCIDIARQLIEDVPGQNLNVIMGGGRQCLQSNVTATPTDPIDEWSCQRNDGRNLIDSWRTNKENRGFKAAVLENNLDLNNLDTDNVNYVLGIFANGHLPYEHERNDGPAGTPSLAQMTEAALKILVKNSRGFILVVEGGLIDQAHHRGWARKALSEVAAMDLAVETTVNMMRPQLDETLIIVTSDHSHTLSINGYANRGDNILGVADTSKVDGTPYTTLTYSTGGPAGFQYEVDETGKVTRKDPSKEDTTSFDYVQQIGILTDENTHEGTDVSVHAIGPMAHLFHRVHEQSYVAHVISYAARIGRFRDNQVVQSFLHMLGLS